MCTEHELRKISRQVLEVYRNHYGNDLVKVYLYGSYARGDYDETSDIDYAAIVRGKRQNLEERLKLVWEDIFEIAYEYDMIVSPVVIPYEEFERMKEVLPYYRNIETEGVAISA